MDAISKRKIVISVMIVLLVVSFAWSSGVLARYVSTSEVKSNGARVAKWGFDISVDATDILGADYNGDGVDIDVDSNLLVVDAEETAKVILPGSTGSMNISIGGTSEVLAKLTVEVSGTEIFLQKDEEVYYPIVWTLQKDSVVLASGGLDDINAYFADDPATSDVNELEILPNTHSAFEGEYVLSWAWAFTNASSDITDLSANQADTLIGFAAIPEEDRNDMQIAALEGYDVQTTFSVSVSIVIEQIQK